MGEREGREIRLAWLLGQNVTTIAARMGRDRHYVGRVIRERDLDAPERPLEVAWLVLQCACDAAGETQVTAGEVDAAFSCG